MTTMGWSLHALHADRFLDLVHLGGLDQAATGGVAVGVHRGSPDGIHAAFVV